MALTAKKEKYRVEDLFVSSLRQEQGGLCITGLAGCCEKLFKPRTAAAARSSRIIRAGMRFLGGDRTLEEHHAMTASLALCRCDIKEDPLIRDLHKSASGIGTDPLNFVILELAFAIMEALSPRPEGAPPLADETGKDLAQVVLGMEDWNDLIEAEDQLGPLPADWVLPEELQHKEAEEEEEEPREEEPPWPSEPDDVFPSVQGPAQTLQNLLLWTAEPSGGSGIFLLLARLTDHAPPFFAALAASPLAIPCALVHLEQALDRFASHAPPASFRLALAAVTHFLHHLSPRRLVRLVLFPFSDVVQGLTARIDPALAEMPGPEAAFARTWWAALRRGVEAGPTYPWHTFGLRTELEFDDGDSHRVVVNSAALYRLMRAHRERLVCKNPDCAHRTDPATGTSTGKAMMFCRRCALVCYCSAACQKHAWSKGPAPHKPLCNAADALRRALGLLEDVLWKDVLTYAPASTAAERWEQICEAKGAGGELCLPVAEELLRHDTAMWATEAA
ncbi:hypothetical protein B0H11DRAFT_1946032 [Mycena galericulata]|nr:hypothetical protein B0H11DRAFT_1946032 [Mycena galericulata]